MANNTNTPNNGEKQNEASELLDEKKNLKHTIFKDYFTSLLNTKNGTNFVRGLKANIYNGLTNGQKNTLSDGYFDYIAKSYRQIGRLADADKTIVIDELFNGKYKNDVLSGFAQEASILMKQEKTLERKILTWYTAGAPNMALTDVKTKIGSLSGQEINIANYSSSRLTNLVNTWHKEFTANTDDIDFVDKKIDQIAAIIAQSGLNMSDPDVKRVTDIIEAKRSVPIDTLTRILGNIDNLSIEQKQQIFVIIRPTLSLKEYISIIKNDTIADNKLRITKNNEIIEDIIANSGIVGLPAIASNEYKAIYNRIIERIDSNRGTIFLSTEDLFEKHGGINNAEVNRIFDNIINENIGTNDDPKKRGETLTNFSDNILDAKPEDPNKDNTTLEEELSALKEQGEQNFARLKKAGIEADTHEAILMAFIQRLNDLRISDAQKIQIFASNSGKPLYIVYRSGGINQYVEITKYNSNSTPVPTISCINHTDTNGEFYKNEKVDEVPIDQMVMSLARADRGEGGKDSFFTKGENGRVVEQSFIEELVRKGTLTENVKNSEMKQEQLEKKLTELDGEKMRLEPGLLIRTLDTQGKPMFIEVKSINEIERTISVDTAMSSNGVENIVELKFHVFLDIFNRTQCKRIGKTDKVENLIKLFTKINKPPDAAFIKYNDSKLEYKNDKEKKDWPIGGFRTRGEKPDHIFIEEITDAGATFLYVEEAKLGEDKDGDEIIEGKSKSVRKYKNVSLKFLADQLSFQKNGDWYAFEDNEEIEKRRKEIEEEDKEKMKHDHHGDHPPHYHGGPLQWMAHSKNFGHLFKGMGMAFGELKHFIEHGDEHVAKEMEYAFISWMRDKPGLRTFMPEEIYLDMKAEIESKKLDTINKLRDKWGGLSTKDCGKMAKALLNDKHTTNEQMFGIIFALNKKTGNLYGVDTVLAERNKIHIQGIKLPVPIFLWKLCVINGLDPKKVIPDIIKKCESGDAKYEGNLRPIPEMHLLFAFSQLYLQAMNPPPVPGSFHAKIKTAWGQGEAEQKKAANEGEADGYSTTDQIEKRMYMLARDGEVAQSIGFYEKLIPRGAPMHVLMGLPFIIATTGLREHMSASLIRNIHISGVYENGFSSGILTALESQEKHDNFQKLLKALAETPYIVGNEPILSDSARSDLSAIFAMDLKDDMKPANSKDQLKEKYKGTQQQQKVDRARIFWDRHGKRLMRLLDATDEHLVLLQKQKDIPGAEFHFKETQGRTDNKSFNANLTAWKNGHYDIDSTNYTLLNPKEAAASFQGIDRISGKFGSDDNAMMHKDIFMSFKTAFQRVRNMEKNSEIQKNKFFEMHYEILRKIMSGLGDDMIEKLRKPGSHPDWYQMLKTTIGFDIRNYNESEVNGYNDSEDPAYRAKAEKEFQFLINKSSISSITGSVSDTTGTVINPAFQ